MCWSVLNNWLFGGWSGWGEEALVYRVYQFRGYKYSHRDQIQAANVMQLNLELERGTIGS